MTLAKKLLIPLLVLVIAVAGALVYALKRDRDGRSSDSLLVSGNIEVTDVEVSFKLAGHVAERPVDEGRLISEGDLVARLDDADLREEVALSAAELQAVEAALAELVAGSRPEEITQAEAALRQAQARLAELVAGSRPQEIASAEAAVNSAKAEAGLRKSEYDRARSLYERSVVSADQYDAAKALYDTAVARLKDAEERAKLVREGPRVEEIEAARAAAAQAQERLALVRKGPREETIEQGKARVAQARAALALARIRLGYATVLAPLSGVILSKNVEAGEYVVPGVPVVTIGDLKNVWLRAYVNESDLGRVKLNQKALLSTDTYPDKLYEGRLSFISSEAEFTPKNVQTPEERVKLVYRIKIDVPNPDMELKPGMPADARILLNESAASRPAP
ncbi:MAG: efflux RND transporter periplasmic adaptor subunit [Planctomycetota bacterium]